MYVALQHFVQCSRHTTRRRPATKQPNQQLDNSPTRLQEALLFALTSYDSNHGHDERYERLHSPQAASVLLQFRDSLVRVDVPVSAGHFEAALLDNLRRGGLPPLNLRCALSTRRSRRTRPTG